MGADRQSAAAGDAGGQHRAALDRRAAIGNTPGSRGCARLAAVASASKTMRKPALPWIAAAIAAMVAVIAVVIAVTLNNQSRIYTANGAVDLGHPESAVVFPTAGGSLPPTTLATAALESTSVDPVTQPPRPTASQPVATPPPAATPTTTPQPTLQPAAAIFYDDFADPSS